MEERILNALSGTTGKSAKEVAHELGEATPIVMEQLRTMAATGQLTQRQVGREQVFSLTKKAVPTPREILPRPTVSESAGKYLLRSSEPVAVYLLPEPVPEQPKPTLYDRIGGTIELEIGDSPIKARFQSVEQLHRFLTELIDNERAGHVQGKGGPA